MTRTALPELAAADQQSRRTHATDRDQQRRRRRDRPVRPGAHARDRCRASRARPDCAPHRSPRRPRLNRDPQPGPPAWDRVLDRPMDGYAELRFWYPPGTPPAQITATALRALDAVTSPPARDCLDM